LYKKYKKSHLNQKIGFKSKNLIFLILKNHDFFPTLVGVDDKLL